MLAAIVPAGFAIAADMPEVATGTVPVLAPIRIARPRYQSMQPGRFSAITNAAGVPECLDLSGQTVVCDGTTMLQVAYFGGKVIPNAKVYAVFWTSAVASNTKAGIGDFYQALTNSAWMDWLTEYSTVGISGGSNQAIGRGTYAGSFTIVPGRPPRTCVPNLFGITPPPGTICIRDTDIPAELNAQINAGNLPMPDQHTIYMFHFPPSYDIQSFDRTFISDSCVQYCAFHSTYSRAAFGSVYYGVMPDLGANGCQLGCGGGSVFNNLSSAASHELGEAITDAEVGLATDVAAPVGWYDGAAVSQGEIGDMCNQSTDTITPLGGGTTYTLKNMFSKVIWDALKQPTTLACVSRRFATNDYTVFFNPNTQSVASGGNVSIPIHLETTQGTPSSVTLSVSPLSSLPAGVHAAPSQTTVLSMPSGSMPVSNLNITVDPGTVAAADLVVVVNATSGIVSHSASVLLQVVPATPTASSNSPVCTGSAINLSTPALAGAAYAWTGPNGFTSTQQSPTITNATATNSGTYSVTLTVNKRTSAAGTTTVAVNTIPSTPVITAPANAVSGAVGLIASVTSHTGNTYAWTITNGTITLGQGTSQLTFTAGLSGSVSLGVVETSGGCSPSSQATASVAIVGPPQNVIATASSSTAVSVSWLGSGAPGYEVMRRDPGGAFTAIGTTSGLSFNNNTNVSVNTVYLYAVRAIDSVNNRSALSNADLASTFVFTDDPLVGQSTTIKASHLNELRTAVAQVRVLAGLPLFVFTTPALAANVTIKASDVTDLRTALDQARSALGPLPALTYTDTVLTTIKGAHVGELRDGVR